MRSYQGSPLAQTGVVHESVEDAVGQRGGRLTALTRSGPLAKRIRAAGGPRLNCPGRPGDPAAYGLPLVECRFYMHNRACGRVRPGEAATNLKKHGVPLDEAAESLLDPLALVREDELPKARRGLCWSARPSMGGS
jgi:hypothetical protein